MKLSRLLPLLTLVSAGLVGQPLQAADSSPVKQHGYTVTVDIMANEKGEPEEVKVVKSEDTSPGDVLTKMAVVMAAKTKLPVRQKDGKPVKYTARAPFFFPIEGDEGPESNNAPKPRAKASECRQPTYPPELLKKGEVGGAIFEMVVDTQGAISRLTTMRASHPEFEQAAREALQSWKFVPAEVDGKPVETRWRLAMVFDTTQNMADVKWRIAPRPSYGSFVVIHDTAEPEAAQPADGAPAADAPAAAAEPAKDAAPSITFPAPSK